MKDSISRFIDKLAAYEALIRYLIRGVITIRPRCIAGGASVATGAIRELFKSTLKTKPLSYCG
mgnify:CR=1 FL=1